MNYFSDIARLIYIIPLFGKIICFLFFFHNEIEYSYTQTLFLIATDSVQLLIYDLNYLINYGCYMILRLIYKDNEKLGYKQVNKI